MIRRRVTMAGYRAATRISGRARRRARHSVSVPARGTDWRVDVYKRQNHTEHLPDIVALTPRQRRRVQHKENAGR